MLVEENQEFNSTIKQLRAEVEKLKEALMDTIERANPEYQDMLRSALDGVKL